MQKQNKESFFKHFFVWFVQFLKKYDESKFSWLVLLFKHFLIKIQPNMCEQEKKWQRICDLLNTKTKQRKIFTVKELFKEKEEWRIKQKMKRRFFNFTRNGD